MKKQIHYLIVLSFYFFLFPGDAHSQLSDRLKNAAQNRAEDRATQKTEEAVDKGVDGIENAASKKKEKKKKEKEKETPEKNETGTAASEHSKKSQGEAADKNIKDNAKFDFVPGNVVLYQEDFSQDVLDEFPLKWATDNKGVVVNPSGTEGKWMRMSHSSQFISPLLSQKLPDNFTVEFDMIINFKNESYVYPQFKFRLLESLAGDKDGRKYLNVDERLMSSLSAIDFIMFPNEEGSSKMEFQTHNKGERYFTKEDTWLPQLDSKYNKTIRISLWVQKQRVRFWIDSDKIYDIPQAIPLDLALNRMAFQVTGSIQPDNEIGVYVTNIRIAAAGADTRSKLITEGKFSTNGILFDTNSDRIKPASAPVLKDIAAVLKENPTVKVRIIGHTDSDGSDTNNMELSRKRAAAVKQALNTDYGIEASRMETGGSGESQPVADNATEEGKAKNRRVEFIKL